MDSQPSTFNPQPILLIDNYDSFVFNLSRYLREMGQETTVVRNDRITVGDVRALHPAAVVLSPGPCTPDEAGISMQLVRELSPSIPILGVCLGHQSIAAALGGAIVRAPEPVHGRTSLIRHDGSELFDGLPNPFPATRYHSLMIDEKRLPRCLSITARTVNGLPMALRHEARPVFGVQFHPESILTMCGHRLLCNFLRLTGHRVSNLPPSENITPTRQEPDLSAHPPQPLHW